MFQLHHLYKCEYGQTRPNKSAIHSCLCHAYWSSITFTHLFVKHTPKCRGPRMIGTKRRQCIWYVQYNLLMRLRFVHRSKGNLDERCTDALVWELMLQAGPVGTYDSTSWYCFYAHLTCSIIVNVHLPKDRISMAHQGYGFCEFLTEEDAEYACKIMNQIKLWGKPIRVNKVCRRFLLHIVYLLGAMGLPT